MIKKKERKNYKLCWYNQQEEDIKVTKISLGLLTSARKNRRADGFIIAARSDELFIVSVRLAGPVVLLSMVHYCLPCPMQSTAATQTYCIARCVLDFSYYSVVHVKTKQARTTDSTIYSPLFGKRPDFSRSGSDFSPFSCNALLPLYTAPPSSRWAKWDQLGRGNSQRSMLLSRPRL